MIFLRKKATVEASVRPKSHSKKSHTPRQATSNPKQSITHSQLCKSIGLTTNASECWMVTWM